jgi:hypothetical protein
VTPTVRGDVVAGRHRPENDSIIGGTGTDARIEVFGMTRRIRVCTSNLGSKGSWP